jgi:DNA-binding response OmpR family regulator
MRDTGPILLVEDDPEAAELLRIAFQKAGLRRPLRVLPDGEKAVAYLSGDPPYDNSEENPAPCLVLLDLKLPRRSGLEVLSWLRSRINTRPLPVVMMTSSAAESDIEEALRLGIEAYCVKPSDFEDLKKLARMIRRKVDGHDGKAEVDARPVRRSSGRS